MTPVTDPNILAQLNAPDTANLKPVTDPAVLAQLNGAQQPQQNQSFIDQMASSPLINGVLGAGDALAGTLSAGLYNPHTGSGTAYDVGKMAGNIGGFLGGGEILDTARAGAEALPYAGQIAKLLGGDGASGVARRALGSAGYGALTNPNGRTAGAAEGAAISGVADALPGALGLAAKATDTIRPTKYAQQIVDQLGSGKSIEDNAKSLAQDLQNSYQQQVQKGRDLYNNFFANLGGNSVYNRVDPITGTSQIGNYEQLGDKVFGKFSGDLEDLHDAFIKNPTLNNAHKLQSQLGSEIGSLSYSSSKGQLDPAGQTLLSTYKKARDSLLGDIDSHLSSQGPDAVDAYKAAATHWRQNVTPYTSDSRIAQVAKGEVENPGNIANLFKFPEPEVMKIVQDMGPDAPNKILYSELGKISNSSKPENLVSALQKLDEKGLGSYVTPSLAEQLDTLSGKIGNRELAQKGAGVLAGASLLHPFGAAAAGIAGATGMAISPAVMRFLQARLPISQMAGGITNAAKAAYDPLSKAIIANTIPGGQQ